MSTDLARRHVDTRTAHVLLVDDEPAVVAGLRRQLHGRALVHTATSGAEALEAIADGVNFAVVVSDMQMPGMNGATLLRKVWEHSPRTVRVLLTGHADVNAAVDAINHGWVFRFLWKPCQPQALLQVVQDAVLQHQLITAERELQERTLRASIRALLDTLALANPTAFTRADRIKRRVTGLASAVGAADGWQVDIASMLAQLGTVSLPPEVVERLHRGQALGQDQQQLVDRLPEMALEIVGDIPRLGAVRDMIRFQPQRFDGRGPVADGVLGEGIPLGARLLAVATAYDTFEASGLPARQGLASLRGDEGRYDPDVLDALEAMLARAERERPRRELPLDELEIGMVLAADVTTADGVMLCGQGQQVTDRVLERLNNWPDVAEPIAVRC